MAAVIRSISSRLVCQNCLLGSTRNPLRNIACTQSRLFSSESNLIITNNEETGISTVSMNKKPVNGLSLEFLTDIHIALEKLENQECKGIILTSTLPTIFSAGLDIMEMYNPQPDRLREFWRSLQDVWLRLYGSNITTIAAINGHAPAGGALLSMCCDYRIMAEGKFLIGLNETLLGIVAPFWFKDTFVNTVGHREAEYGLQLGKMYTSEEALQKNLVDKVVPQDTVVTAAEEEMQKWLKIPEHARTLTKMSLRRETIQKLQARREEDIDNFVNFCMKESIQKSLGLYLQSLKKKK